jgi:HEAT repeat protein
LGPSAAVSLPALARLLDSSATPSARTAAAEALGRLGDARAVPALTGALSDPLAREVAARSLGWLGPKAAGAVGTLIEVTRLNTGAVVNPNTGARSYDAQATRALAARTAATQALAKIGGARAQTALSELAGDPEIGRAARSRILPR